jgi:hypothetical protein
VAVVGPLAASVKSIAVPARVTVWLRVWAVLAALAVRVNTPVSGPGVVGLKTICRVQLALTASVVLQVLAARLKLAAMAGAASVSGRPPLLVRVSVWAGLARPTPVAAKVSVVGVSETPGGAAPVPVRAMVWVRNWSATVSVAVRVPVAVGVNVTESAQVELAASEAPQPLATAKSPGETLAAISVSATPPALVSVTCCAALVVVICCVANVSASGERVSVAGELPVPVSWAVWVPALSVRLSVPERVPLAVGVKVMEIAQAVEEASVAVQVLA